MLRSVNLLVYTYLYKYNELSLKISSPMTSTQVLLGECKRQCTCLPHPDTVISRTPGETEASSAGKATSPGITRKKGMQLAYRAMPLKTQLSYTFSTIFDSYRNLCRSSFFQRLMPALVVVEREVSGQTCLQCLHRFVTP